MALPPVELKNTLGEYPAAHGKHPLRIAETEKYHVTFFFNGGVEQPCEANRRSSPARSVATYDLEPEMSAYEAADEWALHRER